MGADLGSVCADSAGAGCAGLGPVCAESAAAADCAGLDSARSGSVGAGCAGLAAAGAGADVFVFARVLLRSASSSSMSRGALGVAPSCAPLVCLRRRPPRRPRRRLPVPAAFAPAAASVGAACVSEEELAATGSAVAAGFIGGASCDLAAAGASCAGLASGVDADSVTGFDAAGAAGLGAAGRAGRVASSARGLAGFDCAGLACCEFCWRERRESLSRPLRRPWPLDDDSERRLEGRSRRVSPPLDCGERAAGVDVAFVTGAVGSVGVARNQPNKRPSKPPEAGASATGAAATGEIGSGAGSACCGMGVARWMPLTAGSSP